MELMGGNGEPDIRERPFEELPGLEDFNAFYRNHGGVVSPPSPTLAFLPPVLTGQGGGLTDI
jgi:hypothetical protein